MYCVKPGEIYIKKNLNMVIKFLLFFLLLSVTCVTQSLSMDFCDLEQCNYEGIWAMDDLKCECVKSIYVGDKCEIMLNHCEKNLCKNSLACTPFPSSFSCQCDPKYAGHLCDLSNDYFREMRYYFNRVIKLNEKNYILVTMQSLGTVEITLEITTSNYMIESFSFPKSGPKYFNETDNPRLLAKSLGIRKTELISEEKALYVITEFVMTDSVIQDVKITLVDSNNSDEYYSNIFKIIVIKDEKSCYPGIKNYQW